MKYLKLYVFTILSLMLKEPLAATMLPTGGIVIHGDSVITSQNRMMAIGSTTKNNVITWNDFSVGKDHIVQFDNNNYLNIVKSSNPSVINGTVQSLAGGKVHIVNPNGITVGKDGRILSDAITLSTSKINTNEVNAFLEGKDFVPSKKGMGNITLLGYIRTKNLVIDGSKVMIKDIGNIRYGNMSTQSGLKLDNQSNKNFEIYSSTKRIDIGGNKDINLEKEYGFTKEQGVVSQLGKTAISDRDDFLNITNNLKGDYFITNDLNLGDLSNMGISNSNTFSGSIDGAFNTVSYTIKKNNQENSNIGLFSKLDNAKVENLKIENASIEINNCSNNCNIGALAGSVKNSELKNIQVTNLKVASDNNESYIGGIAGAFENGQSSTSIENISASFSSDSKINNKDKTGLIAGINNDNLKLSGAVFYKDSKGLSAFGSNKTGTKVNKNSYTAHKDYIEINNEYQNKNFYNPFFIDADINYEYNNSNPKEYDYLSHVDNPYFNTTDYVDIHFEYQKPIKDIGEYSHIYSSKENGTKFYFVHNGVSSEKANHKIKITGVNQKEQFNNQINALNNKAKGFTDYYNQNKENSLFRDIKIDPEQMNTDNIRVYRLNLSDDFIFNRKFLASVGLDYRMDGELLSKNRIDEQKDDLS